MWPFKKKQPKPLNILEEKVLEFIKKCTPHNVVRYNCGGYKKDNCIISNVGYIGSVYGDRERRITIIFTDDPRDSGTSFDHPLIVEEYKRLDRDYLSLKRELKEKEFYKNITKAIEQK